MLRGYLTTAAVLCVMAAALSGCAEDYPRLPDLTKMSNILSPQQQDQAIKELKSDGTSNNGAAAAKMPEGQK